MCAFETALEWDRQLKNCIEQIIVDSDNKPQRLSSPCWSTTGWVLGTDLRIANTTLSTGPSHGLEAQGLLNQ